MLNYEVVGHGQPLVFIHGFGEDLSLWHGLRQPLSDKYKVITLDLPGFGKSEPIASPFNLTDIAKIVHKFLSKRLNVQQYVVFGHSLGGYVSLAMAELFPNSILALGLLNSTSFEDTSEKKANRDKTVDFINKYGTSFFLESFVPNLFTPDNQKVLNKEISMVLKMGAQLSSSVLTSYMLAMKNRPDRSHLLKQLNYLLIVGGLHDQHISYKDMSLQIQMLKHPENGHILTNVAHMSMYEAEKELEKVILNFMNKAVIG
jgi:pimeloyl-ACP methyl ester carboxylesterase